MHIAILMMNSLVAFNVLNKNMIYIKSSKTINIISLLNIYLRHLLFISHLTWNRFLRRRLVSFFILYNLTFILINKFWCSFSILFNLLQVLKKIFWNFVNICMLTRIIWSSWSLSCSTMSNSFLISLKLFLICLIFSSIPPFSFKDDIFKVYSTRIFYL